MLSPREARFASHGTDINPRLHDHAKDILLGVNLAQEDKAAAWEHYHDARDGKDLSARLKGVVPDELKNQLVAAKDKSVAPDEPDAVDKVVAGINRIGEIAPKVLALTEKRPTVLKLFVDAALKDADEE
jgi:hypothetical protein